MKDLEILKTASLFSIFQGVLWVVYLLFNRKGKKEQRHILIAIFTCFCLFVLGSILLVYGNTATAYKFSNLTNLTVFLILPLFYHFICIKMEKKVHFKSFFLIHYLPFLILFVYNSFMLCGQNVMGSNYDTYSKILIGFFYIQNLYYCYCIYKMVFKAESKNLIGSSKKTNEFKWIKNFFLGLVSIVMLKISIFFIWNFLEQLEICIIISSIFFISSFILINFLILISLIKENKILEVDKYQNSTINDSQLELCYASLENYLTTEKFYFDPLISLEKVAKNLRVSSKVLSQSINDKLKINFNEFINKHRIDEAKNLLLQQPDTNILEIAYSVGFNSKSTFNSTFKLVTGVTPSEYRKVNLASKIRSDSLIC